MNDESWIERYERAGWLGRAGLLGGGAVRLAARAIDGALDRAATVTVEAKEAFQKELDPNVSDAQILDETDERDTEP
ncbi:hypothetical protein RQM47_09730 [Rubrivirga sp. S365]|uniref:Uncharacterized protein n=1 Tax=Rubrivirga litoralis TaxID=3075598 RepID=A0ABU3BUW7_9BACT|nr:MULTISPECIES: hypothetical protein [unclassified Rubrivirga]MDT0633087.1 hypothetical protein [Rubrivirga sp. F394]MDT7856919.1 hypothetical protein [Rubrivirga sp. S365]